MIYQHTRSKIVSKSQHIYSHTLADFTYGSSSMPSVTNAQEAIDWIASVLYPNTKSAVATVADLPTGIDTPNIGDIAPTINDYRIVNDGGTGTAAGYLFAKYDTDISPVWHKIYDFNWGINQVLQGLVDQTQPLYAKKYGATDYDNATGLAITGTFAGQSIWGGDSSNQNLTLNATNFDNTGFVQFNDNARPTVNSLFSLGTALERFLYIYSDSSDIGLITITSDTIASSSGSIGFLNSNVNGINILSSDTINVATAGTIGSVNISTSITTTGGTTNFSSDNILTLGTITGSSGIFGLGTIADFSISNGSITSTTPTISFGSNGLSTTGNISANDAQLSTATIGSLLLSTTILSSSTSIDINSTVLTVNSPLTATGLITASNGISVPALKTILFSTGLALSETGIDGAGSNIKINGTISPTIDITDSIGTSVLRYLNLYIGGSIISGANQMPVSELFRFNSTQFQDVAQTIPVNNGDRLTYDSVSGKWLPKSIASSDHLTILNINGGPNGDGGHSVFPKLIGRTGGQTINGGLLTGTTLGLFNNSADSIGITIGSTNILPSVDSTIDIGSQVLQYKDIYMNGFAYGLKIKDYASSTAADVYLGTDVNNVLLDGRIVKVGKTVYINNNGVRSQIGNTVYQGSVDLTALTSVTISAATLGLNPTTSIVQVVDSTGLVVNVGIVKLISGITISRDALIIPAASFNIVVIGQ